MAKASMAMSIKQVVLGTLADALGEGGSEWPEPIRDKRLISLYEPEAPNGNIVWGWNR